MAQFGPFAFLAATQEGFPVANQLQDNIAVGGTYVRIGVSVLTTATGISIGLSHQPSALFWWTTPNGAVVYQTDADRAATTPTRFVVRASISCVANIAVF